jgi:cysteine sulfinate desulfinase/cysteine desulfurase-like protein
MGALTHGHVRVSVGPETTGADADRFLAAYEEAIDRLRTGVGR